MWKLLVIDDEEERTEQVADWFGAIDGGYQVFRAHSGAEGLLQARELQPDIILLDIIMPGMDGHEVLLRLKRDPQTRPIPVVICSIRADELDGLQDLMGLGLREGADYVVARKWGFRVLEEVVHKILLSAPPSDVIRAGGHELRLGPGCTEVWLDGRSVHLTPLEARVLTFLDGNRGELCPVEGILAAVYDGVGDSTNVYRTMDRIRNKIEPDANHPLFLTSERGRGYRLVTGD